MLKLYVRKRKGQPWRPLYNVGVIQNEEGEFYGVTRNGPYAKPKLKDFDRYRPIFPYRKFSGGSHSIVEIRVQEALDFSIAEGWEIAVDNIAKIEFTTLKGGSYIKARVGRFDLFLVHTWKWPKKGEYKKMTVLGKIAPRSVTGFSPHLHIFARRSGKRFRVRNEILAHQNSDGSKSRK